MHRDPFGLADVGRAVVIVVLGRGWNDYGGIKGWRGARNRWRALAPPRGRIALHRGEKGQEDHGSKSNVRLPFNAFKTTPPVPSDL